MSAAPKGQAKAAAENEDAIQNEITKKKTADAKAKVTTGGSRGEKEVLPKAQPEAVGKPGDEQKTTDRTEVEENGPGVFSVAPAVPSPNDPVEEGHVQVTRQAEQGEPSDPAGHQTTDRKTTKRSKPKKDPLSEIDTHRLPVAVTVGQVVVSVEEYAGRPVVSLSLVGWVGDAPMKLLATDIGELEQALAELRKELS